MKRPDYSAPTAVGVWIIASNTAVDGADRLIFGIAALILMARYVLEGLGRD